MKIMKRNSRFNKLNTCVCIKCKVFHENGYNCVEL